MTKQKTSTLRPSRKTGKKVNYVDNQKFYQEIIEYHKQCAEAKLNGKPEPRLSNYIGICIKSIAERLATKPQFINYSFREEMISDGIENSFLYFKDYDPNRGNNPFAYFTQVIYYAFVRRINKEEKNRYTMYKHFQESIIHQYDIGLLVDDSENNLLPKKLYDNINDFMGRFEEKELKKKMKRKEQKLGLAEFYNTEKEDE
jgi:hypothetical protein